MIPLLFNVLLSLSQTQSTASVAVSIVPADIEANEFDGAQIVLRIPPGATLSRVETEEYNWLDVLTLQDGGAVAVGLFGYGGPFGGSPPVAPLTACTVVFDLTAPIDCVAFANYGPACIPTKVAANGIDATFELVPTCCGGDRDGDGDVDIADLTNLLSHYGCGPRNGLNELADLLSNYGGC